MSARLQKISTAFSQFQNRILEWRKKYPLDKDNARNVLYGQAKYRQVVDKTFDVMINNPHVFKHENLEDMNRKQQREAAVKMLLMMHQLMPASPTMYETDIHPISLIAHALYCQDSGISVKTYISYFLYGKTLYFFASENEIQQKIAKQAMALKHIGCFALTQIGHGSNVKGIQTEARYDHNNSCFYIHSSSPIAMKFWIGALAQLATMAAIWAQVVIDGVRYGPQPFIVPIRDPKTHQVYNGITIGDCGHKNGSNNIDNGYAIFDNYKIPKDYCLNRFSGVDSDGKYFNTFKNSQKLFGFYMAPLSVGRSFVNANAIGASFNALAIALRYTSTRRQFGSTPKQQQLLIDYPLTKYRLMPLIAQAFVYFFGGVSLLRKYDSNIKQILNPQNKILKQLHAVTGPFKAMSSWFASRAITECRALLGGHGYSSFSGLGRMYNGNDINTTWQGDNNMLLQQTTKYILKTYSKIQRGKSFQQNFLKFLTQNIQLPEKFTSQQLDELEMLEKILKDRIIQLCQLCLNYMLEKKGEGTDPIEIWNQSQPYFGNNLSLAFGQLSYFHIILDKINQFDENWKEIARNCLRLYTLNLLEQKRWGNLQTRKIIQQKIINLCQYLAPRSVSIVDTFASPQAIIGSVFANPDGEGMKTYVTKLFTGRKVFERKDWWEKLVKLRNQ